MSKYIPVGIWHNELFMTEDADHTDICGHMIFDVIRPVTQTDLERLQSDDYIYDDCEELWRERVAHDKNYTGGLDDFVEEIKQQYSCDGEEYPFKDDSFCSVLDDNRKIYQPLPEWDDDTYFAGDYELEFDDDGKIAPLTLRQFVDLYVDYDTCEEVGTWEASGCYSPHDDDDYHKPVKFDHVLNEELANKWYKQVGLI